MKFRNADSLQKVNIRPYSNTIFSMFLCFCWTSRQVTLFQCFNIRFYYNNVTNENKSTIIKSMVLMHVRYKKLHVLRNSLLIQCQDWSIPKPVIFNSDNNFQGALNLYFLLVLYSICQYSQLNESIQQNVNLRLLRKVSGFCH